MKTLAILVELAVIGATAVVHAQDLGRRTDGLVPVRFAAAETRTCWRPCCPPAERTYARPADVARQMEAQVFVERPDPSSEQFVAPWTLTEPAPVEATVYRPLVELRSMPNNVVLGQGLLGQPKAYVPGEPIRNFFRYLLP